ncbi:MAG: 2-amino-4-hydroxy-6-hydroxymethyldihydropteridine diphosphokinase, partial [Gemmatimonadota bacterium]
LCVDRVSLTYEAEPVGAPDSPAFLNAAVAVTTALPPDVLKRDVLRPIEARLGRQRTANSNAPRTIDIDIAMVGDLVLRDEARSIEVPDPNIARYAHLAFPLRDLAPDVRHPALQRTLGQLADALGTVDGIRVREDVDLNAALSDRPDPSDVEIR